MPADSRIGFITCGGHPPLQRMRTHDHRFCPNAQQRCAEPDYAWTSAVHRAGGQSYWRLATRPSVMRFYPPSPTPSFAHPATLLHTPSPPLSRKALHLGPTVQSTEMPCTPQACGTGGMACEMPRNVQRLVIRTPPGPVSHQRLWARGRWVIHSDACRRWQGSGCHGGSLLQWPAAGQTVHSSPQNCASPPPPPPESICTKKRVGRSGDPPAFREPPPPRLNTAARPPHGFATPPPPPHTHTCYPPPLVCSPTAVGYPPTRTARQSCPPSQVRNPATPETSKDLKGAGSNPPFDSVSLETRRVVCQRFGEASAPAFERPPHPGPLGPRMVG